MCTADNESSRGLGENSLLLAPSYADIDLSRAEYGQWNENRFVHAMNHVHASTIRLPFPCPSPRTNNKSMQPRRQQHGSPLASYRRQPPA